MQGQTNLKTLRRTFDISVIVLQRRGGTTSLSLSPIGYAGPHCVLDPPSKWYCNDDRDAITARRQSALFPKYGVENTPYFPTCPVALSGSWVLVGFNRALHIDAVSGGLGLGLGVAICDEVDNGCG